ncbi:AAA family ATPase [Halomonas sp. TBZ9]|uniref:AAA family ATPase n=1 Tax=Vreelandella azerica TaxID=2732867 RepID=A0A7Y3TV28_9GAMM|nr:AAA family ATPase [Halomonas azerica]NOG30590.1 AAA family ATPase [Halomonas azerica]
MLRHRMSYPAIIMVLCSSREKAMQWGQLLDINASTHDDERQDPEERLLAQVTTVKMVMFLGKDANLDSDEWRRLFSWLGQKIPKSADDSHLYRDHAPALKRWWRRQIRALDLSAKVQGTLTLLCDEVADLLQLNALETKLLMLTWLRLRHPMINPILLSVEDQQTKKLLALLTGHGSDEIHLSLQNNGRLKSLGLLSTKCNGHRSLDLDDVLSAGPMLRNLAPLVNHDVCLPSSDALRTFITDNLMSLCPVQEAGRFSLASFGAVPLRQLAVDYLQKAINTQQAGANILIYGRPGIGKTELVKTLATQLKVPLYGVPVVDQDDDVLTPSKRLHRYQVVQKLIDQRPGMVMFDEIEDVINNEDALPKGWMNQLLENNPKPGLWVSNSVNWLDPAYLRRFDLIIEVKAQRGEQARERFQHLLQTLPVTAQGREHLSRQDWMTPAAAEQLCRLGQLLNPRTPQRNEQHLSTLMSHRLKALGRRSMNGLKLNTPPMARKCRNTAWNGSTPALGWTALCSD